MTREEAFRQVLAEVARVETQNLKIASPLTVEGQLAIAKSQEAVRLAEHFLSPEFDAILKQMAGQLITKQD